MWCRSRLPPSFTSCSHQLSSIGRRGGAPPLVISYRSSRYSPPSRSWRPSGSAKGDVAQIKDTFARAYAAGVRIAFGTDSGVSAHGDNAREFSLMVEGGMTPLEAIQAATVTAAELLGVEDLLGSIESGKLADIVAVAGDPLGDISLLENISFVMKDGIVYRND